MSAPALALFLVMLLTPLGLTAVLSFHVFDGIGTISDDYSLVNYLEVLSDPYYHEIFLRTESLFRRLPEKETGAEREIGMDLDGMAVRVPAGISVAAALLLLGVDRFRASAVSGMPRAPYCMMGVCFECLVEIDGEPNQQACLVTVRDGMRVATLRTPDLAEFMRGGENLHG
ncbi:binding-protein-dependent transport systems inner membrane component [Castellaniella defragrans 65Phen]|uniref:Binding-protein-dependent transport systems inner membrane component n=1 Tax=Castellaniella defragrans (strain DSM 12143 / CCUG 39792 / 65Phen) TaxID=1437824 RepID=W8WZX4_CASD6|nr:binding-protein-dependent transport systems inner membrane component [Castellaniella defragrans 65Phen]